jgi:hypothetical protein
MVIIIKFGSDAVKLCKWVQTFQTNTPPRPFTLQVQYDNHWTKRRHIAEDCNLFPTQALNKMLGVGCPLRRLEHGLRAARVGFVAVRRNVAACWHSCCIFGRFVTKIWAEQPSRLFWGSLSFYVVWLATWIRPWPLSDFHVHKPKEKNKYFQKF